MEFVALGLGYFPWTTSNCYQSIWQQAEQQSRLEVTDERKRGSSNRGWRRGRRCSHRTVTHPHGQQHQYMYVIYRRHTFAISGLSSLQMHLFQPSYACGYVSPQKMEKRLGFIASNVILMWNGFHRSSTVFFTVSPLLYIYPSLIKSYLQAWGGHQDDQYASSKLLLPFL